MFQKPRQSSDEELRQTLSRGSSKFSESGSPLTLRGFVITLAWIGFLLFAGWVLVQTGVIDPDLCQGTMNPGSC